MELYSIKKGKHHFKGDRLQPAIFQLAITMIGIVLSAIFGTWWFFAGTALAFLCFSAYIQSSIATESIRVLFSKNCLHKLDGDQINILFGFSEGFNNWNSAAIGWRNTDGKKIELVSCCYVNGEKQ